MLTTIINYFRINHKNMIPVNIDKEPIILIFFSEKDEIKANSLTSLLGETNKTKPSKIKTNPNAEIKSSIQIIHYLLHFQKIQKIPL